MSPTTERSFAVPSTIRTVMSAQSGPMLDHYRKVFRFVRRRVGSTEDAEDVTQEVFANAAAALGGSEPESPTLAWLYTVARRRIVDQLRRPDRSRALSLELVGETAAADRGYGEEVARALDAALASMPEGQGRVGAGRLLRGRSFADLGRELGASEEACRMRFMPRRSGTQLPDVGTWWPRFRLRRRVV
jgi:RNA polymerase sigma-70 factor (ECF subfamily)